MSSSHTLDDLLEAIAPGHGLPPELLPGFCRVQAHHRLLYGFMAYLTAGNQSRHLSREQRQTAGRPARNIEPAETVHRNRDRTADGLDEVIHVQDIEREWKRRGHHDAPLSDSRFDESPDDALGPTLGKHTRESQHRDTESPVGGHLEQQFAPELARRVVFERTAWRGLQERLLALGHAVDRLTRRENQMRDGGALAEVNNARRRDDVVRVESAEIGDGPGPRRRAGMYSRQERDLHATRQMHDRVKLETRLDNRLEMVSGREIGANGLNRYQRTFGSSDRCHAMTFGSQPRDQSPSDKA